MKKCPNCNQMFGDENDFCQNDGTPLLSEGSTQETIFLRTPASTGQPFQNQTNFPAGRPSGGSQYLIFGLILLLTVVAVGFGVAYFTSSGKSDGDQKTSAVNSSTVNSDEDQRRLNEKQSQIDAENLRIIEERKQLEADRRKLETQKRSAGPMPPSGSAMIIDPPTNIRLTPNGKVLCVVGSRTLVPIAMSPGILDKNGVWYRTTACGTVGLVHSSQISFSY